MKNLATLDPENLQGLHGTPLYYCYLPKVCRVKITFSKRPTNLFVSTTKKSMKCVLYWIPLRIRVRSRNTQPHLNRTASTAWFLVCNAATQLATQLPQRHIQVVRSNTVVQQIFANIYNFMFFFGLESTQLAILSRLCLRNT